MGLKKTPDVTICENLLFSELPHTAPGWIGFEWDKVSPEDFASCGCTPENAALANKLEAEGCDPIVVKLVRSGWTYIPRKLK